MASKEFKIGMWDTHIDLHKYCYQATTSVLHIGHILTCGIVALLINLLVSLHCRRFTDSVIDYTSHNAVVVNVDSYLNYITQGV